MFKDKKFDIIKEYIDDMDYCALLAGGAPKDEFDMESREISRLIRADSSVQEIAEIIGQVFWKYFDEQETADKFTSVAQKIKEKLR